MNLNDILTWDDWAKTFQDIETFRNLIEEIFHHHNLKLSDIEQTYPATNAVFKVGEYIVKIFVPDVIKPWDADDFEIEYRNAMSNKSINNYKPLLHASGAIQKDMCWKYLVFEFVDGTLFYQAIRNLTYENKNLIVKQLKQFLKEFNKTPKGKIDNSYIIDRVINDNRWYFLNDDVKSELFDYLKKEDISNSVTVHGDITGDNVLLTDKGIVIIDFGDSCVAPKYYEYAPIVVDLFQCDKELIELFFDNVKEGIELTIKSILLHDFGGDIASKLLQSESVDSLAELRTKLRKKLLNK